MTNYGNGNGFKLGGNYTANNATLNNCVSVGNKVKGFDQNNNNGIMTIYNCTSYNNGNNYGFSNSSYGTLIIKNCVSLSGKGSDSFKSSSVTQAYNSWNPGFTCVASDFISLDMTQIIMDRQPDGSLPEISLLHLTPTSGLIDKGTVVGFAYSGTAPDLGAFEYNLNVMAVSTVKLPEVSVYYSALTREIVLRGSIASVDIYLLNGMKVYTERVNAETDKIPSTKLPKGLNLVRVITQNGETTTRKILIN